MRCAAILVLLAVTAGRADAYLVGPAVPLDELVKQVDVVVKATVVSETVVTDPWFDVIPGYNVREDELRVVSVISGSPAKVIRFRHYAPALDGSIMMYAPQSYTMSVGGTYLVFASHDTGDVYRQWSKSHTQKADEGVVLAADARAHQGKTVQDAVWGELANLLASSSASDATYAIEQLDDYSGGGRRMNLTDLDRHRALDSIRPLIRSKQPAIAKAAITVFGGDSEYSDDEQGVYWLVGIGKGDIPGFGALTLSAKPEAALATTELLAVADSGPADLRALAIRVLGRTGAAAARLAGWSHDTDPAIRAAAVLTSAERADHALIVAGATDASPDVRRAAALAIGYAQDTKLVATLDGLLDDRSVVVSSTAAMVLMSLSPDATAKVMKARLDGDYRAVFVNALARRDPGPYVAVLAEVIERRLQPPHWGGTIPSEISWHLLFDYVKSRPADDITGGKLDRALDGLERVQWFGSSEARDLYALYLRRGMTARAKRLRGRLPEYDTYFDSVDLDPSP